MFGLHWLSLYGKKINPETCFKISFVFPSENAYRFKMTGWFISDWIKIFGVNYPF